MKRIKSKLRNLLSFFVIFSMIFTTTGLNPNTIKAETTPTLEWSDYVWRSYTKGGWIIKVYHKDTPSKESYTYCYHEGFDTPPSSVTGKTAEYRKTTVNNKTLHLLYDQLYSLKKGWETATPEVVIPQMVMAIQRGYPANKQNLIAKFSDDEGKLYRGTQIAVWAISGAYQQADFKYFDDTEKEAAKVAKYILGIQEGDSTYKIGKEYTDAPITLPDNIQVSFFEPRDAKYQWILALEDVQDPSKDHPEIHVEKTWGGYNQIK